MAWFFAIVVLRQVSARPYSRLACTVIPRPSHLKGARWYQPRLSRERRELISASAEMVATWFARHRTPDREPAW